MITFSSQGTLPTHYKLTERFGSGDKSNFFFKNPTTSLLDLVRVDLRWVKADVKPNNFLDNCCELCIEFQENTQKTWRRLYA